MAGSLLQLFPKESRTFWERLCGREESLQEIRLRANRPIFVLSDQGEQMLGPDGRYTKEESRAVVAGEKEIGDILQHVCHYSLYAFEDELRQGFVTVAGGHRVGIAGRVVLEGEKIRTIKHISCLNIRVSHQIKGVAAPVLPQLYLEGKILNTLIISPPGCGKTTLLRDLVRQVSDGNSYGRGLSVGIVDERSEIAGCFQGMPQNDVGKRTDVLDGCPKEQGMMILLRAMSPSVIAVDEIGSKKDIEAIHMASRCGCNILATIHGEGIEDVSGRDGMGKLMEEGLFERILILTKKQGKFTIQVQEGGKKLG